MTRLLATLACFTLPLHDHIDPELHELKRSGVFRPNRMNHIRAVGEGIEVLADVPPVERAPVRWN